MHAETRTVADPACASERPSERHGKIDSWRSATSTLANCRTNPINVCEMMRHFCLGHVSSDISSAWCCDEGAPSSTLHADRIVIVARDKNTPALASHEPTDASRRAIGPPASPILRLTAARDPYC